MPKARRTTEILVPLARRTGRSLRAQIEQALREAVRAGRLAPAALLPSTRTLAGDLGVSRGVVVEAYEQLIAEGYLVATAGSGTRVTDAVVAAPRPGPPLPLPRARPRFDFRPGEPDLRSFPWEEWKGASRQTLALLRPEQLGYGEPQGAPELRSALIDYLARARGVVGTADQVVVCTGAAQGLSIAARVLRSRGVRRVALEDPSHPEIRRIVGEAGITPVPVRVDADGLDVEALERAGAAAVVVSPAHQNPLGSVLAPARRQRLLAWARRRSAWILEDDYDAEYRYDRAAVGAIQGLDPKRVLYLGTASKILAPGLRLGWLVIGGPLLAPAIEVKRRLDNGSPVIQQLTYARFVASGELDRHLRRMRQSYQARRDALLRALERHFPGWAIQGAAAGLHLVAEPPARAEVTRLVARAARRSVQLYPLSDYGWRGPKRQGLVFGYARLAEDQIAEAIRLVAAR